MLITHLFGEGESFWPEREHTPSNGVMGRPSQSLFLAFGSGKVMQELGLMLIATSKLKVSQVIPVL